jgi:hypothetical protein
MNPENTDETQARREFLKHVGRAAIVAPAVTLLLSARSRKALAGSGGNWGIPPNQTLKNGKVEYPTGKLNDFTSTDHLEHLEAWVVQYTTGSTVGATQRNEQTGSWGSKTSWLAKEGQWNVGTLQVGSAIGVAVVAWTDGSGTSHTYWWSENINLVASPS